MTILPPFKENLQLTLGTELEWQLVNLHNFNLVMEAGDFLRRLSRTKYKKLVKPEITQSMIEINSSVHTSYDGLISELTQIQDAFIHEAKVAHIGLCGGGTHPFQKWKEQKIFQTKRFVSIAEQYGYLAQQFTIFGQHIHIGCPCGDDALYLCHALAYYVPHFIALSASSPFNQGIDTSYDCSRLAVISAFPLSGTPPWLFKWQEFEAYFDNLSKLKIVQSMKDFYWDIRPKPEFGTVEIRVCDTPLTIEKATDIAFYIYNLAHWLLLEKPDVPKDVYLTYLINRFRATRFGFDADIINPVSQTTKPLSEDILETCRKLEDHAVQTNSISALERIKQSVIHLENGAKWLRQKYDHYKSLSDVVRAQVELWQSN
ncbi:MAG TPA: YbdK family carboxylate-amine ligase [Candidatus Nitrosotenuis sp.]|jgi:carboxylate-amine ligase|nr:YbdK family carboxylate-amine ligase [Candidatus Nitrosotenuis sp.]